MTAYDSYLNSSLNYLKEFVSHMKSRPIIFIGSGFSRRYMNSPSWRELLDRLINENPEIKVPIEYFIQEHNGDNAKIASQLVEAYRDYAWKNRSNDNLFPPHLFASESKSIYLKYKISAILHDLMDTFDAETNAWVEELRLFSKLNPQAFITTNYDNLLESLFPKYTPIVGQQVIHEKRTTNIGNILKIHGSIDDCNGIVIEKQDYDNFFKNQIYLIAKLFTYFMEHPIVFIGYSVNDENIKSILYNVKQIINIDAEPLIQNMWFIDWNSVPINPNFTPPREKSIPVGNGESVRLNYIMLNTYEMLYETLYQDSVDIEILKQLEETVYNVVKSDTITNLEVDIASLRYLTDRENFLNSFTTSAAQEVAVGDGERTLFTFATITDPNQLALLFPLSPSVLCSRVYDNTRTYWSYAYDLIKKINAQVGVNLRATNNEYHVEMNGVSRYSLSMVNLLKQVKDNEPYSIVIDGRVVSYPPAPHQAE